MSSYTEENLNNAIEAVKNDEFNVPRLILIRKMVLLTPSSRKMGPTNQLSETEDC